MRVLEVLGMLKGSRKISHPVKGGGGYEKVYPVLRGDTKSSGPSVFPCFCCPPPSL